MIEGRASDLIADLFPAAVAVSASPIADALLAHAHDNDTADAGSARRVRESVAARACARRLLAGFGVRAAALLPDADGRPRWPDGFVGSISHARDWCVVAVARREQIAGLGIDIEVAQRLEEESWDLLCSAAEIAWLHRQRGHADTGLLATALFSAKESSFKCAARVGERFEPRAYEIVWEAERFRCHVPGHGTLFGQVRVRSGWIVSGCQLPARPTRDSSRHVDVGSA